MYVSMVYQEYTIDKLYQIYFHGLRKLLFIVTIVTIIVDITTIHIFLADSYMFSSKLYMDTTYIAMHTR